MQIRDSPHRYAEPQDGMSLLHPIGPEPHESFLTQYRCSFTTLSLSFRPSLQIPSILLLENVLDAFHTNLFSLDKGIPAAPYRPGACVLLETCKAHRNGRKKTLVLPP